METRPNDSVGISRRVTESYLAKRSPTPGPPKFPVMSTYGWSGEACQGVLRPQLVTTRSSRPSPSKSPVAMPFHRLLKSLSPHSAVTSRSLPASL